MMATLPASAEVTIDITKGTVEPLPIAITDFLSGDQLGANISGVIAADLERSGLFAPIEKALSSRRYPILTLHRASRTGKLSMHRRLSQDV